MVKDFYHGLGFTHVGGLQAGGSLWVMDLNPGAASLNRHIRLED
jgi:hypothetical protein